ncbi:MAG: DUF1366 domain-containing protein [Eubacteriales bacterium]
MIKGINKQSIIVQGDGEVFEQAIFIINPKCTKSHAEILREAEKLINQKTSPFRARNGKVAGKRFGPLSRLFGKA